MAASKIVQGQARRERSGETRVATRRRQYRRDRCECESRRASGATWSGWLREGRACEEGEAAVEGLGHGEHEIQEGDDGCGGYGCGGRESDGAIGQWQRIGCDLGRHRAAPFSLPKEGCGCSGAQIARAANGSLGRRHCRTRGKLTIAGLRSATKDVIARRGFWYRHGSRHGFANGYIRSRDQSQTPAAATTATATAAL